MTVRKPGTTRKTKADTAEAVPETDRKGFVHVKKDDTEARIVPESLGVWEDNGWSLADIPEDVKVVDDEKQEN